MAGPHTISMQRFKSRHEPKDMDIILMSKNKATARAAKEFFASCKLTNKLIERHSLSSFNSVRKNNSLDLVIVDADSYNDGWEEIVKVLSNITQGVVVLSSFSDEEYLLKARNAGAIDYILKPFESVCIDEFIRELKGFSIKIVKGV